MNAVQQQFFTLVQSGLWGTEADASLFGGQTDWEQIYQAARAQALMGIVLDGIQTLPAEKRPSRGLYLKWCNTLMQIEEKNRLLNRELANVYALCRKHGVEPVLLKGQGVAQNYRNPLHRQCGDIDLYIGAENYAQVNNLLRTEATGEHEENHKHTSIEWHGVTIENHRTLTRLSAPAADRFLQREIARWHNTDLCRRLSVGDCLVTLPPLPFEVVYILTHSALHFLNEGIGLRQVCDWACLLHHERENIDRNKVAELLRRMGLTRAAQVFGVVAVKYLKLPVEDLPVPYSEKDLATGDWLMEDIWQGGNFGQFDTRRKRRPKGYWSGKWYTFTRACKRCYELGALAPAEARWYPMMLALHSAQAQWNRLTGKQSGK